MNIKNIEIFCGTGGVGKTTISTSRAIFLARQNLRVLLITIDPARRLKQLLNLDDYQQGTVCKIQNDELLKGTGKLSALLLSPSHTLERILGQKPSNNILKTLSKDYGGLNEIMAVLEVQHHINSGEFDVIILDTPPGKHFLDFLEASKKIHTFFNKNFSEIFNFLKKRNKPKRMIAKIITSGVDKLLTYLEKVTGSGFVNEFIEAVHLLYEKREIFIQGLDLEKKLMKKAFSNWFLVTSADQIKGNDADELLKASQQFMHEDNFLIINKSWEENLHRWKPNNESLTLLREKLLEQEERINNTAIKHNVKAITFPEIFHTSPMEQVESLLIYWEKFEREFRS